MPADSPDWHPAGHSAWPRGLGYGFEPAEPQHLSTVPGPAGPVAKPVLPPAAGYAEPGAASYGLYPVPPPSAAGPAIVALNVEPPRRSLWARLTGRK